MVTLSPNTRCGYDETLSKSIQLEGNLKAKPWTPHKRSGVLSGNDWSDVLMGQDWSWHDRGIWGLGACGWHDQGFFFLVGKSAFQVRMEVMNKFQNELYPEIIYIYNIIYINVQDFHASKLTSQRRTTVFHVEHATNQPPVVAAQW